MTNVKKGILDNKELNSLIRKMSFSTIIWPIIIFLIIFMVDYFDLLGNNNDNSASLSSALVIVSLLLITEFSVRHVYKYYMYDGYLEIFYTSAFGRKRRKLIPLQTIKSLKFRQIKASRNGGKLWLHFDNHVEEYVFLSDKLGQSLTDNLNVEKI